MSSFSLSPRNLRRRAGSHGGLGGFVEVKKLELKSPEECRNGRSWPRRQKRPLQNRSPLRSFEGDGSDGLQAVSSVVVRGRGNSSPTSVALQAITSLPTTPHSAATTWREFNTSARHMSRFAGCQSEDLNQETCHDFTGFDQSDCGLRLQVPTPKPKPQRPANLNNTSTRTNRLQPSLHSASLVSPAIQFPPVLSPPVELPGSLLLASQGYPQSNPPATPPRPHCAQRSLSSETSDSTPSLTTASSSDAEDSDILVMTPPDDSKTVFLNPPVRNSSLVHFSPQTQKWSPSTLPASASTLKVVPLSIMTIEQLIDILPSLDAAIIAADWIPAIRARCQSLKSLLQDFNEEHVQSQLELQSIGYGLIDTIDQSKRIATAFNHLIEAAQSLIDRDHEFQVNFAHHATDEVENHSGSDGEFVSVGSPGIIQLESVQSKLQRVLMAFEQTVPSHAETSTQRNMEHDYLHCSLNEAIRTLDELKQQVFQSTTPILAEKNGQERIDTTSGGTEDAQGSKSEDSADSVNSSLERSEFQALLYQSEAKLEEARSVIFEQQDVIQDQSQQLDGSLERIARCLKVLRGKDGEIQTLQKENEELRQLSLKRPHALTGTSLLSSESLVDDRIFTRDAEIKNLRSKLAESYIHTAKLQREVRGLVQDEQERRVRDDDVDQVDATRKIDDAVQSPRKHFTFGNRGPAKQVHAQALGTSSQFPAEETRIDAVISPIESSGNFKVSPVSPLAKADQPFLPIDSSARNGDISPLVGVICDLNMNTRTRENSRLGFLPLKRRTSSDDLGLAPRLRENVNTYVHKDDATDIKNAVSGRFAQIPAHIGTKSHRASRSVDLLDSSSSSRLNTQYRQSETNGSDTAASKGQAIPRSEFRLNLEIPNRQAQASRRGDTRNRSHSSAAKTDQSTAAKAKESNVKPTTKSTDTNTPRRNNPWYPAPDYDYDHEYVVDINDVRQDYYDEDETSDNYASHSECDTEDRATVNAERRTAVQPLTSKALDTRYNPYSTSIHDHDTDSEYEDDQTPVLDHSNGRLYHRRILSGITEVTEANTETTDTPDVPEITADGRTSLELPFILSRSRPTSGSTVILSASTPTATTPPATTDTHVIQMQQLNSSRKAQQILGLGEFGSNSSPITSPRRTVTAAPLSMAVEVGDFDETRSEAEAEADVGVETEADFATGIDVTAIAETVASHTPRHARANVRVNPHAKSPTSTVTLSSSVSPPPPPPKPSHVLSPVRIVAHHTSPSQSRSRSQPQVQTQSTSLSPSTSMSPMARTPRSPPVPNSGSGSGSVGANTSPLIPRTLRTPGTTRLGTFNGQFDRENVI